MFKVGDAVRVKAGICSNTHRHISPSFTTSMDRYRGRMGTVQRIHEWVDVIFDRHNDEQINYWDFRNNWLEPWNDAEEWDGSKWVTKKKLEEAKQCVVVARDGMIAVQCESTNAAFRKAEELANKHPGQEQVVYQEKGSRKVEKKSRAEQVAEVAALPAEIELTDGSKVNVTTESVSVHGDTVRVIYKVKP